MEALDSVINCNLKEKKKHFPEWRKNISKKSVQTVQTWQQKTYLYSHSGLYCMRWQNSHLKCMGPRDVFVAQSHYREAVLNKFHRVPDANTENTTVGMERRLSSQHAHWETYNHPQLQIYGIWRPLLGSTSTYAWPTHSISQPNLDWRSIPKGTIIGMTSRLIEKWKSKRVQMKSTKFA